LEHSSLQKVDFSQVPVKVEMVQSGTQYVFERLLVLNQALTLSVEVCLAHQTSVAIIYLLQYLKVQKKGKRSLQGGCCGK
jgi:hypothetical protein